MSLPSTGRRSFAVSCFLGSGAVGESDGWEPKQGGGHHMLSRKALAPPMIGPNAVWRPFLIAFLVLVGSDSGFAQTAVDLALVLTVDVSPSMEIDEQELQRQGFIEAFRSTEVHNAVRKGAIGRIAVMYVEWADASLQEIVVPWTVIEHPADGFRFAASLAGHSIHAAGTRPYRAPLSLEFVSFAKVRSMPPVRSSISPGMGSIIRIGW